MSDLYAPEARARDVIAVLDDLGIEKAHFWGYSMGGQVGLMFGGSAR
ncbi:MAG: alpha/beta fold hydrolase [Thermomicrobiales bacterium]